MACQKLSDVSPTSVYQKAIASSRDDLGIAEAALRSACAQSAREHTETDQERMKLGQAIAMVVRKYIFIRGKVQDALVNVDPDAALAAGEIERRERLVNRVLGFTGSDLERMGQGAIIEFLSGVGVALNDEPDLKSLGFAESFTNALDKAKNAAKDLNRENDEDSKAMAQLRLARDAFDRAARAHGLQVESILIRQSRQEELGRFILAKDAAYAARRVSRAPVADEPGASDVDNPPPQTPAGG
jgi:hypothetical protein